MQSHEEYLEKQRQQWAYEQECEQRDREELPDRVRDAVQELALMPGGWSLDRWNVISNTLLSAAKEIEELRKERDAITKELTRAWDHVDAIENKEITEAVLPPQGPNDLPF